MWAQNLSHALVSHWKQICQSVLDKESESASTSEAEAAGQVPCQQGEPHACLLLASEDGLAHTIVQATVGHAEAATSGVMRCM